MYSKIYLDSNVFIAFFDGSEEASPLSKKLLYGIGTGEYSGCCSVLLFVELLEGQNKAQDQNELLFNLPGLSFVDLDQPVSLSAQKLRSANRTLKSPDAIHLATAMAANCQYFISQDQKLNKIACKYLKAGNIEQFYR